MTLPLPSWGACYHQFFAECCYSGSALGSIRGRKCLPLSVLFWLVSLLISSASLLQFSQTPEIPARPQHHLPLQHHTNDKCEISCGESLRETPLLPRKAAAADEKETHMHFRQGLLDEKRQRKLTRDCQSHRVEVTTQTQAPVRSKTRLDLLKEGFPLTFSALTN